MVEWSDLDEHSCRELSVGYKDGDDFVVIDERAAYEWGIERIVKRTDGMTPYSPFSLYLERYRVDGRVKREKMRLSEVIWNEGERVDDFIRKVEKMDDGYLRIIHFTGFRYGARGRGPE